MDNTEYSHNEILFGGEVILNIEPRASHLLGKSSTSKL